MSELIQHFNLLDEVFESLSGHVALSELFDSDSGPHPTCLEDITVATSPDKIVLGVDLKLLKVDVEVEAILFEGSRKACGLPKCH